MTMSGPPEPERTIVMAGPACAKPELRFGEGRSSPAMTGKKRIGTRGAGGVS